MERKKIKMISVYELMRDIEGKNFYLPFDLYSPGSTPWYDLLVLAVLSKKYKPKVIFEIGSFEGLGAW